MCKFGGCAAFTLAFSAAIIVVTFQLFLSITLKKPFNKFMKQIIFGKTLSFFGCCYFSLRVVVVGKLCFCGAEV